MTKYDIEYGRTEKVTVEADTLSDAIHIACDLAHKSTGTGTPFFEAKEAWAFPSEKGDSQ